MVVVNQGGGPFAVKNMSDLELVGDDVNSSSSLMKRVRLNSG